MRRSDDESANEYETDPIEQDDGHHLIEEVAPEDLEMEQEEQLEEHEIEHHDLVEEDDECDENEVEEDVSQQEEEEIEEILPDEVVHDEVVHGGEDEEEAASSVEEQTVWPAEVIRFVVALFLNK